MNVKKLHIIWLRVLVNEFLIIVWFSCLQMKMNEINWCVREGVIFTGNQ